MLKTIALLFIGAFTAVTAQDFDNASPQVDDAASVYDFGAVIYLHYALSDVQYKAHSGNSICVNNIDSIKVQPGTAFDIKYSVNGCELPKDSFVDSCQSDVNCQRSQFDVEVHMDPWNDTLQITSITRTQ